SWMYRIVQNLWLASRRRGKVRGTAVDPGEAGLHDDGKGARAAEDRIMLARFFGELDRLPDGQRAVQVLVAVEGLTYREVAETLDIPVGTVTSRLVRAREGLSLKLAPRGRVQ